MVEQNTFMETIKAVAEIIRTSATPLSEKEILGYFEDMELDDNQKKIVMEYLSNPENIQNEQEEANEDSKDESKDESVEEGKSAVFQMYLEELSYLPKYSKEEKEQLYKQLLQGDESVIRKISDAWLKKVLATAEKYIEPKLLIEDLIQEGNMALFLKLQELCKTRENVDVEKELAQAIEEGIVAYASEMSGERELENSVLGKVNLVHEANKLLAEENGRDPSIEELSEYTKMPVEELQDIMDMIKSTDEK